MISEKKIGTFYQYDDKLYILETFSDDPTTVMGDLAYPARLRMVVAPYPKYIRLSKNAISPSRIKAKELSQETHPELYL